MNHNTITASLSFCIVIYVVCHLYVHPIHRFSMVRDDYTENMLRVVLNGNKPLDHVIVEYNTAVDRVRQRFMKKFDIRSMRFVYSKNITWNTTIEILRESNPTNFIHIPPSITKISLELPVQNELSNLTIEQVCSLVKTVHKPIIIRSEWDQSNWLNGSIQLNSSHTAILCRDSYNEVSMPYRLFNELAHVHVIRGGYIDGTFGSVHHENVYIVPSQCVDEQSGPPVMYSPEWPVHDEIYVITQFWGEGYFHNTVENQPRLTLLLPFLMANTNIKIHVPASPKTVEFLEMLGITSDRIINGPVLGKLIYLPQGTLCGIAHSLSIQAMSRLAGEQETFNRSDTVVLIQRSTKRYLIDHDKIEIFFRRESAKRGMNFVVYSDRATPTLKGTREIFRRAAIVVAPHGAALSNIVFCRQGTVVIEALCKQEVNMCYQRLAFVLGHRYHGIVSKLDCPDLTIDLRYFERVAEFYMDSLRNAT